MIIVESKRIGTGICHLILEKIKAMNNKYMNDAENLHSK